MAGNGEPVCVNLPYRIEQYPDIRGTRAMNVLHSLRQLGHSSVKTVLDVYGHLYEGLDRSAADTLDPPWDDPDMDALWTRRNRHRDQGRGLT